MGDLNAKVGNVAEKSAVGKYGLRERNERGTRLVEFAEKHRLVICNTHFQQHPRRLYTWRSPEDIHRNQIDYILINNRYRKLVSNCHTYPVADCGSDHVLLAAKCRLLLETKNASEAERRTL